MPYPNKVKYKVKLLKLFQQNFHEDFHEFLRAYTDIFTKHIYATKDFTYKNLKNIIKDENIAVLSGDKDFSIVIMQNIIIVTNYNRR